ncbi:MAG: hypothetical protein QM752_04850 [Gammaproteobacteria bacterium]
MQKDQWYIRFGRLMLNVFFPWAITPVEAFREKRPLSRTMKGWTAFSTELGALGGLLTAFIMISPHWLPISHSFLPLISDTRAINFLNTAVKAHWEWWLLWGGVEIAIGLCIVALGAIVGRCLGSAITYCAAQYTTNTNLIAANQTPSRSPVKAFLLGLWQGALGSSSWPNHHKTNSKIKNTSKNKSAQKDSLEAPKLPYKLCVVGEEELPPEDHELIQGYLYLLAEDLHANRLKVLAKPLAEENEAAVVISKEVRVSANQRFLIVAGINAHNNLQHNEGDIEDNQFLVEKMSALFHELIGLTIWVPSPPAAIENPKRFQEQMMNGTQSSEQDDKKIISRSSHSKPQGSALNSSSSYFQYGTRADPPRRRKGDYQALDSQSEKRSHARRPTPSPSMKAESKKRGPVLKDNVVLPSSQVEDPEVESDANSFHSQRSSR